MNDADDLDLSPFLEAARAPIADDAAEKADVLARLEITLGLPPRGGGGDPPRGGGGGQGGGGSAATLAKACALVAAGAIAGAAGHAALARPPKSTIAPLVVAAPPTTRPAAGAPPPVPALAAVPIDALPSATDAPVARPSPSTRDAERKSALDAERTLLETARTALLRGDPTHALAALDEHRARFPRGQLTEERESLAVYALVAAGRKDDARARAEGFRRAFPTSLQRASVEALVDR